MRFVSFCPISGKKNQSKTNFAELYPTCSNFEKLDKLGASRNCSGSIKQDVLYRRLTVELVCVAELFHDFIHEPRGESGLL